MTIFISSTYRPTPLYVERFYEYYNILFKYLIILFLIDIESFDYYYNYCLIFKNVYFNFYGINFCLVIKNDVGHDE